jgi:hypothetical protein
MHFSASRQTKTSTYTQQTPPHYPEEKFSEKIAFILQNTKGPLCIASETVAQVTSRTFVLPKLEIFGMRDLFYTEKCPHYTTGCNPANNFATEGNGQMSLLLNETYFLCRCLEKHGTDATVIYIDAYPGDHIPHLSKMFPSISFHLYDERFQEKCKISPTSKITINAMSFNDDIANSIRSEFEASGKALLYISLLRDKNYGKNNSSEENSHIIDQDMWKQLKWAQIMKPQWSLIRFRPKLDTERPAERPGASNVSRNLTDPNDPIAKRRLYYNYPPGFFLRIPMAKKNRLYMFLMTCADRTNGYKTTETYYHDDIISICRHQNEYVRRVVFYANPFTDTYSGIYGLETVRKYAKERGIKGLEEERYICGNGWDHSAMFHIMSLYVKQANPGISPSEILKETSQRILDAMIGMETSEKEA